MMFDDTYKMLSAPGEGLYKEKGSKFIALAFTVMNEDEVKQALSEVKKKYYDARHHCYAYMIGPDKDCFRSSDDGEPSGTAGMPVLSLLEHAGITNTAVAVTRYFGGILLGKGGLVRAYTESAKLALQDGHPSVYISGEDTEITVPYSLSDRVMFELGNLPCEIRNTEYMQDVRFIVAASTEDTLRIRNRMTEITAGVALFDKKGVSLIKGEEVLL